MSVATDRHTADRIDGMAATMATPAAQACDCDAIHAAQLDRIEAKTDAVLDQLAQAAQAIAPLQAVFTQGGGMAGVMGALMRGGK